MFDLLSQNYEIYVTGLSKYKVLNYETNNI